MWAVHADADMRPLGNNTHKHTHTKKAYRHSGEWACAHACGMFEGRGLFWSWMRSRPCLRGGKRPQCRWSLQPQWSSAGWWCQQQAMHRDTHPHHPRHPHSNVPQLRHCSGPFHSPQAGLGTISLLRKKLCKSFHPLRWALGPLTWVDILICCRLSLRRPHPPVPPITERRDAWQKKKQMQPCWFAGGGQQWSSRRYGVESYR